MAKVTFNKLGLSKDTSIKTINYNGQVIEVKQYLPVNEKLELISNVVNNCGDHYNFANPLKTSVYSVLEIIGFYTNITFTEKQKEDPCKLYDLLVSSGLSTMILSTIPEIELAELLTGIEDTITAIYAHYNSVLGILEAINQDYSNINFDLSNLQTILEDKNNVGFLRELMPLINGTTED